MAFAPLSFFRRDPPRTATRHLTTCHYKDTQDRDFHIDYLNPTIDEPFSFRQVFPKTPKGSLHERSLFTPPPHYHLIQNEHFVVESGKGVWHLEHGKDVLVSKGETLVVTARRWHWFETAPDSEDDLSVVYFYDKELKDLEDQFFRNLFGDMTDRRRAGMGQSLLQLNVLCLHNWMTIEIVRVGPEWFNFLFNTVLMVLLGLTGQFLFGYKPSYDEYYDQSQGKSL